MTATGPELTASWYSPARLRQRKPAILAALSILGITTHLVLRFAFHLGPSSYRLPLLGTLIIGGAPMLYELLRKLLNRDFGSDLLGGIAIITSVSLGEYLAGSLIVLMLAGGEALESYALRSASSVLAALAKRVPSIAHRKHETSIADVALPDVVVGDTLVIYPHEICPVDGVVIEGHGMMDESYLTGEPFQSTKTSGSAVISGAINGECALTIRTTQLAADSRYAKIMEVMRESESKRPSLRRLGDQLGAIYTPVALTVAALAWVLSGESVRFLAVLVIATPCPLLIAIPVAIIGSISLCARRAIIVKSPVALEHSKQERLAKPATHTRRSSSSLVSEICGQLTCSPATRVTMRHSSLVMALTLLSCACGGRSLTSSPEHDAPAEHGGGGGAGIMDGGGSGMGAGRGGSPATTAGGVGGLGASCLVDNGGCDPRTTCTEGPKGRECGACPPQYSGDGKRGCVEDRCAPHSCQNGGKCFVSSDSGATCSCPPGHEGEACELSVVALSVGSSHACALLSNDTISCWGGNEHGEASAPSGSFTLVAAGGDHTCAKRTAGDAVCWGANSQPLVAEPGKFTALSSGEDYACAVNVDGAIVCWGSYPATDVGPPTGAQFEDVSAGGLHTCALARDGSVACWGNDDLGQSEPPEGVLFSAVKAGGLHSCGIRRADSAIECWGSNEFGQLEPPPGSFDALAVGGQYGCAIERGTHLVRCWGQDSNGSASPPPGAFRLIAAYSDSTCGVRESDGDLVCWGSVAAVPPPHGLFTQVAAAESFSCALKAEDASVECFGWADVARATPPSGPFKGVGAEGRHVCALRRSGEIECWGEDQQLSSPPQGIFSQLSVGSQHACALRERDSTVQCWGADDYGQSDAPPGAYQAISVAWNTSCALTALGEARCWGWGDEGQTLPPQGEFIAIAAGGTHACGIRPDGTVECWGLDDRGQASPPPAKRFRSIAAGAFHTCGVRADDFGVECWGQGEKGEASPPPGPFQMVSATNSTTCGITAKLKLQCWGRRL